MPSERRRSTRLWALCAGLSLALLVGWYLTAARVAEHVQVSWAGPPRCLGAEYAPVRSIGPRPVIHARRGSRCTITVVVHNASAHTVHLDRLVAPYMGLSGGAVLVADPQPPVAEERRRLGDDTDAHYELDRDLAPGRSHRVEITGGFREQGCSHARTRLSGFPSLELTVLGRDSLTANADHDLLFLQQGPSSACEVP